MNLELTTNQPTSDLFGFCDLNIEKPRLHCVKMQGFQLSSNRRAFSYIKSSKIISPFVYSPSTTDK
jgi:hypothetical protein